MLPFLVEYFQLDSFQFFLTTIGDFLSALVVYVGNVHSWKGKDLWKCCGHTWCTCQYFFKEGMSSWVCKAAR